MGFRPLDELVLPPGALTGRRIVLDPNVPEIAFYSGAAAETSPARVSGADASGNPRLEMRGPSRGATPVFFSLGAAAGYGFFESEGDLLTWLDIASSTEFLQMIGTDADVPGLKAGGAYVQLTAYETTAVRMQPQTDFDVADSGALSNTAYGTAPGPSGVGFSFVAPPSGRGLLVCFASLNVDTTAAVGRTARVAPRLGTGGTIGGGTAQNLLGVASPHNDFSIDAFRSAADGAGQGHASAGIATLVSGLTSGDTYNLELQSAIGSATSASYERLSLSVSWFPIP